MRTARAHRVCRDPHRSVSVRCDPPQPCVAAWRCGTDHFLFGFAMRDPCLWCSTARFASPWACVPVFVCSRPGAGCCLARARNGRYRVRDVHADMPSRDTPPPSSVRRSDAVPHQPLPAGTARRQRGMQWQGVGRSTSAQPGLWLQPACPIGAAHSLGEVFRALSGEGASGRRKSSRQRLPAARNAEGVHPAGAQRMATKRKNRLAAASRASVLRWRPHGDSNPGRYRERVMS